MGTTDMTDMDKEILAGFLEESLEGLGMAENLMIRLEKEPDDLETVDGVFRPVHSLKGSAAFFGLMQVKTLAHKLEDLLDAVRRKQMPVTTMVIDVLLPGVDLLRRMLTSVREGGPECDDPAEVNRVCEAVVRLLDTGRDPLEHMRGMLQTIAGRLSELRHQLPEDSRALFDEPLELLRSILPGKSEQPVTSIASKEAATPLQSLIRLLEQPFDGEASTETIETIGGLLSAIDSGSQPDQRKIREEMLDIFETFAHSPVGLDNLARESLLEMARTLKDQPVAAEAGTVPGAGGAQTAAKQQSTGIAAAAGPKKPTAGVAKSMRIPEDSLDAFLENVGELMGVEEMFRHLYQQLARNGYTNRFSSDLKQVIDQFGQFSTKLRSGIMDVRKVEAQALLGKAPRIVRDIATAVGKRIAVRCTGEKLRIDKSYIELLDAPLVHMVRNAADHGIEPPAERLRQGKPADGTIHIELREEGSHIVFSVADDGRGLDMEALSRKAAAIGFGGDSLSTDDIISLIFKSGVSTAAAVTDVSGRGVGLDVVKQAIEQAGGRIDVHNSSASGCEFIITLPKSVSTKIMDGYLVRTTSGDIFVLPLRLVVEVFAAKPSDLTTLAGKRRVVNRRGMLFPVIDLGRTLSPGACHEPDRTPSESEPLLVLLSIMKKKYAFAVTEVIGVQKIVVKPIEGLRVQQIFEGAAMMGDGRTALIVGEEGLTRIARDEGGEES
ncbi:MAG: chemotaxis protein CheA [Thermodesulfobacteriota bacterium]